MFLSSRRRHSICLSDWSSDVCSSDLFSILNSCDTELRDGSPVTPSIGINVKAAEPFSSRKRHVGEKASLAPSSRPIPFTSTRSEERRVGKYRKARLLLNYYKRHVFTV